MTPETMEKKAIKEYLDLKKIFNFPLLAGLGCAPGLPDRVAIRDGEVFAIEVKTQKSKGHRAGVQSDNQKEFERRWALGGGVYILGGLKEVMKHIP